MRKPRTRIPLVLAAATVLALAGCNDATQDANDQPVDTPTDGDATDDGAADGGDDGAAAGGTTMRVHTVTEALQADGEGTIHVSGLLIDDGSGWRLCELVMESYPPQCGGDSLVVEDVDPSEHPLEESDGVRWQTEATVVGEVEGDTLTVTGSPAAS